MDKKKRRAAVPGGTAEAAGLTDQREERIRQLHADAVEQGTPTAQAAEGQSDAFYWQRLCALRTLARLCWSTAELQECAIRTLGPDIELKMLVVVLDEELPAYRRVAAAFLLDFIAPGWRREIGGITISFVRTLSGTPRSRGNATGVGGRVGHSTPRHWPRCNARRVS
jgi:hypothetical protein